MNISDTFYMALCMTILIIGVVYWFWTQTQYIQRKLNLLENIVYEMKTSMNTRPEEELRPAVYPPAPSSELGEDEDLLHEELHAQVQAQAQPVQAESQQQEQETTEDKIDSDLQPGGVGSTTNETKGVHDSMTLKQLRQIAEQKKIPGASAMRKQALIEALRNADTITPFEMTEGSTLDLS